MSLIEKYMEQIKKKDVSALEQVYLQSKNAVFSVIYSVLKDYRLSEDLMQETYIKVWNNINQYHENTNPLSWICTIAKNLAINYYNKQKKELSTDFNQMSNLFPSYEINTKDESGIFEIMSKSLDENEQKIILMHTIGGIKLKEIAKLFNKPQGTVRWQYNNALKKLLKILNKEDNIK